MGSYVCKHAFRTQYVVTARQQTWIRLQITRNVYLSIVELVFLGYFFWRQLRCTTTKGTLSSFQIAVALNCIQTRVHIGDLTNIEGLIMHVDMGNRDFTLP